MRGTSFVCACGVLSVLSAFAAPEASRVPEWLPEESRFAVTGATEEVAETLGLMRDAFLPRFRAALDKRGVLGPVLQWMVRMQRGDMNDQEAYLGAAFHPLVFSPADFPRAALTNAARRIRYIPPVVALEAVYGKRFDGGDFRTASLAKAEPGVDYPSPLPELGRVTRYEIDFTLRAPERRRRIRLKATPVAEEPELEYAWRLVSGYAGRADIRNWGTDGDLRPSIGKADIVLDWTQVRPGRPLRVAVFARRGEDQPWGPPAVLNVFVDPRETRRYGGDRQPWSVDYGNFTDTFEVDEKGAIVEIQRSRPINPIGERFTPRGEQILATHPGGRPARAAKTRYFETEGKMDFEVTKDLVTYPNVPPEPRTRNE